MSNTLGYLCIMLLLLFASMAVSAQDEPEPMRLRITYGSLPSLVSGTDHAVINPTGDNVHDAKYVGFNDDGTFRHYYLESGSDGCLFTANPDGAGGVKDIGGGRSMTKDTPVAYISEGYHVYALVGQTCSAYGVQECQGAFCR